LSISSRGKDKDPVISMATATGTATGKVKQMGTIDISLRQRLSRR
jgi:hypothetical protein